ncbi:MAG: response regulator, partial [Gammaproteobacteria bacterium]|nr:response regulator [Gammaproteobacteria bacterium]
SPGRISGAGLRSRGFLATVTNILIVDDDPAVRAGLALLVRACGWAPHAFESGDALLAAFAPEAGAGEALLRDPVCMLLDLQMPGLTGPEVQDAMRERGIDIPTVIVTAYAEHPLAERARRQGAVAVLRKPVLTNQLRDVVEQALLRYRGRLEVLDAARARPCQG